MKEDITMPIACDTLYIKRIVYIMGMIVNETNIILIPFKNKYQIRFMFSDHMKT